MLIRILNFVHKNKYEFLLFALLQHTFTGIFLDHVSEYDKVWWPLNMIVLISSCFFVAWSGHYVNRIMLLLLAICLVLLPLIAINTGFTRFFMETLGLIYALFFMYILYVLLKFLIRPSYFNSDIISASICGYMVLIEIMTFLSQTILCFSPHALVGIGYGSKARVYIDCIYFSTITITSIG